MPSISRILVSVLLSALVTTALSGADARKGRSLKELKSGTELTADDLAKLQEALDAKTSGKDVDEKLKAQETRLKVQQNATDDRLRRLREGIDGGISYINQTLNSQGQTEKRNGLNLNRFWVLIAALLVFFMQAGFKSLEVGMVEPSFGTLQALYKLAAWIATCTFYFFSFGLMFSRPPDVNKLGNSTHIYGSCGWRCSPQEAMDNVNCVTEKDGTKTCEETDRGIEFFLFQAAFAATAVTIPAGAIAQRMGLGGYFLMSGVIAYFVYPLFGSWAWGGGAVLIHPANLKDAVDVARYQKTYAEVSGWLRAAGFHDFAGSTVVHSIGGWFALAAAQVLPRRENPGPPFNRGYAVLGVFMLWFGWWGFNGGSMLLYDEHNTVPNIILNTNLAAAGAGIAACLFAWLLELPWWGGFLDEPRMFLQRGHIPEKIIGGILGGLVAITASCDVATPWFAFCIVGISAGIIHNLLFDLLLYKKWDDPVGAFPVHAGCGMLGTFLVTLAPNLQRDLLPNDALWWIQLLGIAVAGVLSYGVARLLLLASPLFRLGDREKRAWGIIN